MDTRSDAELVRAVRSGAVEEFAALVERYQDAYRRFAVRMLGSRDDADDALQLAFVRAYRSLGKCRDPERFGAWLYRIVLNECRTLVTRRDRREKRFVRVTPVLGTIAVPAPNDDGTLALDDVQRALDELAPEQREAFLLKHVEGLSYDEMAELTGVGVSALKMRVKRGCERLRELLEGVPS